MYRITDEDIDFVGEDLLTRGIRTESLRLNLIDHICILAEEKLESDGDFRQFYALTIKTFYQKELCELETETHLLLYQNNYIMKKAVMISGLCSAAGFIAGSVGKIFLLRLTDFFMLIGFASFVLVFLPLVLIVLLKGYRSRNELVIYGSGIASAGLYFYCMMMKCVGLPASSVQLGFSNGPTWLILWLTSLAIGAFVFVPAYLIRGLGKPELKIQTIITSILLIAFIGVQFRLTNLQSLRARAGQTASAQVSLSHIDNDHVNK
jgi:hypothetical protein